MSDLLKIGRKKAINPEQEKIREEKDSWNGEVSDYISALISLKKGVNGRGDKNTGLPPSKITEVMPDQISSYLSETSSRSHRIFELANRIIRDQNEYATHRTSSKQANALESFEKNLIASELIEKNSNVSIDNIEVQGSWWGSRWWAKNIGFRKLQENEKIVRRHILESCSNHKDQLKKFENFIVDTNNPVSIPMSSSILTSLLFTMATDLLPTFFLLRKIQLGEEKNIPNSDFINETVSDLKNKSKTLPESELTDEISNQINKLEENLPSIGVIVGFIKSKISSEEKLKILNDTYDEFSKKAQTLIQLNKKTDYDSSVLKTIKKLIKEVDSAEFILNSIFEEILGKEISYEGYLKKINVSKSAFLEVEKDLFFVKKAANNAISRWYGKKILKVKKNPTAEIRLSIVEKSLQTRESLNSFMNRIELNDSEPAELGKKLLYVINDIVSLSDKIEQLCKIYVSEIRREVKPKDIPSVLREIKQIDFKRMRESRLTLESYIRSL